MRLLSLPPAVAERLRIGDERILVTGATGWLGQSLLEMLSGALGPAFQRRVGCFGSAPKAIWLRHGITITQDALTNLEKLPNQRSILFHFAYLTKEKTANMTPGEYIDRNRSISTLAERAAGKVGADRILLISSGAVYQALAARASVASVHAYGALKLEEEALFQKFASSATSRRVLAVRLFNLAGPYINKLSSYALSSFIEQARHTAAIDIRASHRVIRSYTSVENLLGTALAHLLADAADPWLCMDTAGERDVEVGELATLVRALVHPAAEIRRPPIASDLDDRYVGDALLYHAMAARHGIALHSLHRQIQDTLDYLAPISP